MQAMMNRQMKNANAKCVTINGFTMTTDVTAISQEHTKSVAWQVQVLPKSSVVSKDDIDSIQGRALNVTSTHNQRLLSFSVTSSQAFGHVKMFQNVRQWPMRR